MTSVSVQPCETFTFTKDSFSGIVLPPFRVLDLIQVKKYCDEYVEIGEDLYKCVINHRVGKDDWWVQTTDTHYQKGKKARLLTALFYIYIHLTRDTVLKDLTAEEKAHERLERLEIDLQEEKINEQKYIEECKRITDIKTWEEQIEKGCKCNLIGCFPVVEDLDPNVLTIMELPCCFSDGCSVVGDK
jgi:hypothetical protein